MTPQEFCYWLQGYFELRHETDLHPKQVEVIKQHLGYVFTQLEMKNKPPVISSSSEIKFGSSDLKSGAVFC